MVYSTICASQLRKKVQEMFWNPFRKFGKSMDFHDFHGFSSFWPILAYLGIYRDFDMKINPKPWEIIVFCPKIV